MMWGERFYNPGLWYPIKLEVITEWVHMCREWSMRQWHSTGQRHQDSPSDTMPKVTVTVIEMHCFLRESRYQEVTPMSPFLFFIWQHF